MSTRFMTKVDKIPREPCTRFEGARRRIQTPRATGHRPHGSTFSKELARSPKGQQLIEQASKPENRRKLEELRRRYLERSVREARTAGGASSKLGRC